MEPARFTKRFAFGQVNQMKQAARERSFWILAAMLFSLACLHYLTPQQRWLPFDPHPLTRHAVERTVFILPVASATFAFGQTGGLITLVLAICIMLPRVVFISPNHVDAFVETTAVSIVSYLVVWMIDVQEREKRLRQEAVLRLRTINAITAIVSGSLKLEEIMDGALGKVLEVTKANAGCIYLLDRAERDLMLAVCRGSVSEVPNGSSVGSADRATQLELDQDLIERVMQSSEPILLEDLLYKPHLTSDVPGEPQWWSMIAVPLRSRDRAVGFMYLVDSQPGRFVSQDVQLLTSISSEIGVAIENAWLHQDVARQLHIEQRLNEVAEKITSELELDKILSKVLQIAGDLVDADGGVIALFDREKNSIRYPHLHNLPEELARVTVSKGTGLAGDVMTLGRPLVIKNYPKYDNAVPAFVEAGVISLAGVPLVSGDQLFGALTVLSLNRTRDFSERDVAILTGIGRQAGIAIENSHLYENMRFYVQQITRAQEAERKRVARELHDETIQNLIVLSRRLERLKFIDAGLVDTVFQNIEELQALTDQVITGVRRFSQDLRPSILDDLGLVPALEAFTSDLTEREGIKATLAVVGALRRLSPDSELTLFRIAQEALNNVKRHAEATNVWITVEFAEGTVHMTIQDDGKGFRAPTHTGDLAVSGKLGLIGMYERARLLGGTLAVQSEPGQGTIVRVGIPA